MHTTPYARRAPSLLALALTSFLILGTPPPSPLSAQSPGNAPLSGGGAPVVPDQEGIATLLRAPSGQLFRIWTRWSEDGSGSLLVASSEDGTAWRTLTQIDPKEPGVSAKEGQVAVSRAGEVAVTYRWARVRPPVKRIRLARSTDGGKTWIVPAEDISAGAAAFDPQVAWGRERTLVVAWTHERARRSLYEIHTRRSLDGGATWEPEVVMTPANPPEGAFCYSPRLVGDGDGRFWLVWIDLRGGRSSLRLARSDDNGRTWSTPEQVTGESYAVFDQSLNTSGTNRVLLTWQDRKPDGSERPDYPNRIYATTSGDGGRTWAPVVTPDGLQKGTPTNSAAPSSALASSSDAWVTWYDNRNGRSDVFVARSADGGATWGAAVRLDADSAGVAESRNPKLVVSSDGTAVGVVWEDDRHGLEAIYARIFSGGQWSPEVRLSSVPTSRTAARVPVIIATTAKDTFYVAWEVWSYSYGPRPHRIALDGTLFRLRANPGS